MKDIEWKLISELMKNSRRSNRELAKIVGVSTLRVSRTIKKLETEGFIKEYTIIPNFAKLGYRIMAFTFSSVSRDLSSEEVEEVRKVAKERMKKSTREAHCSAS